MLLDEIIAAATDDTQPLSVVLRKCLVLAHQLRNDQLKAWANQELNGYASEAGLPDYRILGAAAKGHFSGPWSSGVRNMNIPSALLKEKHKRFGETAYLTQAVSAYEQVVESSGSGEVQIPWPNNLILAYQGELMEGFALVAAWQAIAKSTLAELLDTVRNRALNMALEIQDEVGTVKDVSTVSGESAKKVQESIINNIYGGTNYLASGQAHISADTNVTTIHVGQIVELNTVLKKAGLSEQDLAELRESLQEDNSRIAGRVSGWIKRNAPKVLVNGVKLGTAVAESVLIAWIKQYLGI